MWRAWRRPRPMSTMNVQAKAGQGSGGMLELVLERGRGAQADGEAIEQCIMEVGWNKINSIANDVKAS